MERANWKRRLLRKRWRTRLLVILGVGLVAFAVGFTLVGITPPSTGGEPTAAVPKDETLRLTVPKMRRVEDLPVPTVAADNSAALDAGAVHVEGTGFPWEQEANVYIAGHRLGYPNTGSFLLFYDLNRLRDGDRVVLDDATGRRYVYEVFDRITVRPDEVSVTEPIAGKNVVSLQACTLPDYSKRLIVQAELKRIVKTPEDRAGNPREAVIRNAASGESPYSL
ncbi:sortase [Rubrobacter radiotolerans]|uniref:Sortase n=1 Tax=Rubrobacter radiotolerans TaxID=42256 RepID=A0A023X186_RUBRA|nr:sortase [Rubrobacter radiotolerans]SMC03354.1 sortase A [Rubrobacter radiotolerans DSM 5868]